uniref:Regulator of G protein signaling 17 n=1 Tax=Cyprinus carpio TaxID=7962 RepID=A0A8C1IC25_CYPCA
MKKYVSSYCVIALSQNFEMILHSPEGRDVSWEFLQSEFSEENLMFWIACEELKKDTNQSTNAEKARIIYQNYILIFLLNKVSLDSQVREDIIRSLIDPSSMMYDETQLQIYTLVCRDSFLQFLKSLVYRKHFNSKSQNHINSYKLANSKFFLP